MSAVFEKLKKACINDSNYNKWDDLQHGVYNIKYFKLIDTKNFGLKLYVYLENNFVLQMPQRCLDSINQEAEVEELNAEKYKLIYNGKDAMKKNMLLIDIERVIPEGEEEIASKRKRK